MNERTCQRWATTRSLGKWRYVLFVGVFYWGQLCFILTSIVLPAFYRDPTDTTFTPGRLLGKLAIWLVMGVFFGLATWTWNERAFRRSHVPGFPVLPARQDTTEESNSASTGG